MAMKFEEQLAAFGCDLSRETFDRILLDLQHLMFPDMTDEQILFRPRDAIRYCKAIRDRTSKHLTDEFILRFLINLRKSGRRAELQP